MNSFTEEEARIIAPFFTNIDKPIFALRNLPEVVKGALFSRYSRTDKSLRRVLLDEFIDKPEMGFREIVGFAADRGESELVAIKKAEEFYDRVLVGYGDDSVAELGGAHVACENVSNIAVKMLEDGRIGMSPLEKSTRYVFFNEKAGGQYKYYRDPTIMNSEFASLFVQVCDMLFDAYADLIEPMKKFVTETNPREEGVTDRAYNFTIRAKACDVLRSLLPAATLTNVGLFGNGRAFEYLLMKMYASEMEEIRGIAASMQEELNKVIPSFVKRSNDRYGQESQKFIIDTRNAVEELSKTVHIGAGGEKPVTLIDCDSEREAEVKIATAILYTQLHCSMAQIRKIVEAMSDEDRRKIIHEYLHRRANRRHRPGRAFENTHYTFDLLGNFGMYRDLQRHRMLTQEKQPLTVEHGYDTPQELAEAGLADRYHECMAAVVEAFKEISKRYPKQAQYIVPFGFRVRWYFTMNLREAFHLIELRTMQQGHPDYRRMCQQVFSEINRAHPFLAGFMKFVDMNEYKLERLEAEKRLDRKIQEIASRYGK